MTAARYPSGTSHEHVNLLSTLACRQLSVELFVRTTAALAACNRARTHCLYHRIACHARRTEGFRTVVDPRLRRRHEALRKAATVAYTESRGGSYRPCIRTVQFALTCSLHSKTWAMRLRTVANNHAHLPAVLWHQPCPRYQSSSTDLKYTLFPMMAFLALGVTVAPNPTKTISWCAIYSRPLKLLIWPSCGRDRFLGTEQSFSNAQSERIVQDWLAPGHLWEYRLPKPIHVTQWR
jgi:hypothetical protein